jgi:hypothetical protein
MQRPPMVVFSFIHRISGICASCTMRAKKNTAVKGGVIAL